MFSLTLQFRLLLFGLCYENAGKHNGYSNNFLYRNFFAKQQSRKEKREYRNQVCEDVGSCDWNVTQCVCVAYEGRCRSENAKFYYRKNGFPYKASLYYVVFFKYYYKWQEHERAYEVLVKSYGEYRIFLRDFLHGNGVAQCGKYCNTKKHKAFG